MTTQQVTLKDGRTGFQAANGGGAAERTATISPTSLMPLMPPSSSCDATLCSFTTTTQRRMCWAYRHQAVVRRLGLSRSSLACLAWKRNAAEL